jgi:hypothetical protein
VHWIEELLHISPDGGSGTLEASIYVALLTAVAILLRLLTRVTRR